MTQLQGTVIQLGDWVAANRILPLRYCTTRNITSLGEHCFEGEKIKEPNGAIIVAGKNFGAGSVREHPVLALKGAGVAAIVAATFSGAFYRNAINNGLAAFESAEAAASIEHGATITIAPDALEVKDQASGEVYPIVPAPDFVARIRDAGGIKAAYKAMSQTGV